MTNLVLASQFNTGQMLSATITDDTWTPGTTGLAPVYQTTFGPAITGKDSEIGSYVGTIATGLIRVRDDEPTDGDAV